MNQILCSFRDQMIHLLFHSGHNQLVLFFPTLGLKAKIKELFFMSIRTMLTTATDFGPPPTSSSLSKAPVSSWLGQQRDPAVAPGEQFFTCPAQVRATAS